MSRASTVQASGRDRGTGRHRSSPEFLLLLSLTGFVVEGCATSLPTQQAESAQPACSTRPPVAEQLQRWRQYASSGESAAIVAEHRASYQPLAMTDCPVDHKDTYALLASAYEAARNRSEARRYRRLSDLWAMLETRTNIASVQARASRDGLQVTTTPTTSK